MVPIGSRVGSVEGLGPGLDLAGAQVGRFASVGANRKRQDACLWVSCAPTLGPSTTKGPPNALPTPPLQAVGPEAASQASLGTSTLLNSVLTIILLLTSSHLSPQILPLRLLKTPTPSPSTQAGSAL